MNAEIRPVLAERTGVWLLYDGECPMCRSVAHVVRIRQRYGTLHLIDAREARQDPLYIEVTRRGLSLDEGMVIYADGRFHHGKDALIFVARFGDPSDSVTLLGKILFRFKPVARCLYPLLRAVRNGLLRMKGVEPIGNIEPD